jgi:hypothetical protein
VAALVELVRQFEVVEDSEDRLNDLHGARSMVAERAWV